MIRNPKPITSFALLLVALCAPRCALGAAAASPSQSDLEQLLGHPIPAPISKVTWATSELAATNYPVYAVQPPRYDPRRLRALAEFVGVKGKPVRMPDSLDIAPGYWIKQPNPTNSFLWTSVSFSEKTGALGYGIPDNGYRWDLKNHKPLVQGVPTQAEALQRALALLPALGLTTNDLEVNPDGSLRHQFTKEVTGYNDPVTKEHKEMLQKRSVILFQRVPAGETLSVGEGGALEVAFISDGKLAEIGLLFRDIKPFASAKALTSRQIVDAVRRGKAWTFRASSPATLTVTNCAVAYPQGNSSYRQQYLWPVYRVTGFGVTDNLTNTFSVLVPLELR